MHSSNARTYSGDPQKCSEDFGNIRYSGGFPGLTGGVLGGCTRNVPGVFRGICFPWFYRYPSKTCSRDH